VQEFDIIETPEQVELQQRLAGIGSRCMAGLVDSLILALAALVVVLSLWITAFAGLDLADLVGDDAFWWVLAAATVLVFLVYWGYFVLFEFRTNGQTPGKKVMKLRVVKEGGAPMQFVDVAVRNLLRVVDGFGGYGVAGLCMFLTARVQRLGDLAAGTVVVTEEVANYAALSDRRRRVQDETEVTPAALQASGLRPEELRALHNYWVRRNELTIAARERVLPALLDPILKRTGLAPRGNSFYDQEDFVADVLNRAHLADGRAEPPEPRP
jgi:uncharacterized RDD family membrane protein YckC